MSELYIEVALEVDPVEAGRDILIAELGELGFESFVETDTGVKAYIVKEAFDQDALENMYLFSNPAFRIQYSLTEIAQENWNEAWEKSFDPITVNGLCTVRAPFHKKPETRFDIVIEPKMSFGTGHHETTHMMIELLLEEDLSGKRVLDMGCGTGILAILAEMRGAKEVDAIDIDNWCYLNSIENAERNNCQNISVYEGDAALLDGKTYDVIIANINRNILLRDIPVYVRSLNENGVLLLSGFYKDDIPGIRELCERHSLKYVQNLEKNHWVAVKFIN
ncbi:50S ribosomal protein L11 methyltransferase [Robertkochia aurantiaca]|uniref:50S ribosomal protein L11 methyltransferase n=1 Tax=Robertkochia aurantiaca TaxID=2873700 RepID=UPI001CCFCA7B|nr:50S ribosomal protein L11 methyltransferase [Robertkochia sp. 3YJGBD-33]